MNPFQSLRSYEEFLYTLQQRFPAIVSATLVATRRGTRVVTVGGEVMFPEGLRLVVSERLTSETGSLCLVRYGYKAWRGSEKLYWYDSQPHPGDLALAATAPHHKHEPPDLKHNRVPAPKLSFAAPNLPVLIEEIESLLGQVD
ncbi:MAG: hypothetical protein COZ06_37210 [Armatimonadetes bacterium CG_4_10_14_3_um_filter_66_18]|nr:hypothetical protein [Armatimonadota bacterium]OIO97504.1 MAG: hypothetical protein AUJ96_23005 [Armatimonadetes bacterium CG2_30_66_41]PIU95537.1 MAG: hypothetical protein COS65_01925 [Armatimonadetes bacterium CG06_land_8_20_14_3_00_66_21]PIX46370.1 MAG: hypothetical protein COZ57_12425 [Armatimonadetes bacterium CG_4_8_14_3_um_filter_66_20]PIY35970.1 MAG: hypothetical protein COZ06_37210 [Armatimonadetes bacterium CG_4_10_14_3_um_filter_66_18]PIZ41561.1 MAG: hypothetical protein COY42_19